MPTRKQSPKGPWIHRFIIRVFTVVFAVLVFWVLGFLVEDIDSIRGPDYSKIEQKHVDQELVNRQAVLSDQIIGLDRQISSRREEMNIVSEGSHNLQKTMGQLIELQKLTVEKSTLLPESEQGNLSASLAHFLENQKKYQKLNATLSTLSEQKRSLEDERIGIKGKMEKQRVPARSEYNELRRKHNLKLASLQLMILIPLLAVGAFFIMRKRGSIYFPLYLGYGAAVLLKVGLVVHRYFPNRYFKYVLIFVLLLAVTRLLIHFIRAAAFPKATWLISQYREAYERFLCPVCEYPIRTGPRKFLFWTRRSVKKNALPTLTGAGGDEEASYTCPCCGTGLYEECSSCHEVRHSLLPFCQHCQAERPKD